MPLSQCLAVHSYCLRHCFAATGIFSRSGSGKEYRCFCNGVLSYKSAKTVFDPVSRQRAYFLVQVHERKTIAFVTVFCPTNRQKLSSTLFRGNGHFFSFRLTKERPLSLSQRFAVHTYHFRPCFAAAGIFSRSGSRKKDHCHCHSVSGHGYIFLFNFTKSLTSYRYLSVFQSNKITFHWYIM